MGDVPAAARIKTVRTSRCGRLSQSFWPGRSPAPLNLWGAPAVWIGKLASSCGMQAKDAVQCESLQRAAKFVKYENC